MLRDARAGGYAVGAFNAENMEMVQAIMCAAEEARAPVMIQTTPGTLRHAPPSVFQAMAAAAAELRRAPAAMHLDHGDSLECVVQALRAGYTSIMIDGSKERLEANMAITRSAVELCSACGVPVEGELGRVGGKEDGEDMGEAGYTEPKEAEVFVAGTGVNFLAVGVGTAHGVYSKEPKIDMTLIKVLRARLPVPLVLHGASGLADEVVTECVRLGIAKVNFATELRMAYTRGVREALEARPDAYDPKYYGKAGRDAVKKAVLQKIALLGSEGKARPCVGRREGL
jgi:tagatose 1,6-diphosphate aldolase GatY/KbaY